MSSLCRGVFRILEKRDLRKVYISSKYLLLFNFNEIVSKFIRLRECVVVLVCFRKKCLGWCMCGLCVETRKNWIHTLPGDYWTSLLQALSRSSKTLCTSLTQEENMFLNWSRSWEGDMQSSAKWARGTTQALWRSDTKCSRWSCFLFLFEFILFFSSSSCFWIFV